MSKSGYTRRPDFAHSTGPTGSCLSPILFNVFFRDILPADIVDKDVRVAVYADDICVTVVSDTVEAAALKLSEVLDSVESWGRKNRVRFDKQSEKCGYVVFSKRNKQDQVVRFGRQLLNRQRAHKYLGVIFDESLSFSQHIAHVKAKAWRAYHVVRRVVGDKWGATTKTVIRLYEGLIRPILEAACVVWDGASAAEKVKLERVHRLSLLAATGANSRTSTRELEVYCNTQPLQDRRDFVTAIFYNRVLRLNPLHHPVATAFCDWQALGAPPFSSRVSFLPRAAALCRRLCRFSRFEDGGREFLERIPSPPARKDKSYEWRPQDKERAKSAHIKLINRLNRVSDIIVYTDGSATPNPGRIGLGVSTTCAGTTTTYGTPIGVGSNITAELCAIHSAINSTLLIDNLQNFKRVFFFSDCRSAIDLSLRRCTPTHSFDLVTNIHEVLARLRSLIAVTILWVPAHVGVPGNEAANTAAQDAANRVQGSSPLPGQPPIPLSTSRAFIKSAQKEHLQRRWFTTVAEKSGTEHLSRLRADVSATPAFFVGSRKQQTILARLRFGSCHLNASKSRWYPNVSEQCACGEPETVRHFLMHCRQHELSRDAMMTEIRTIWQGTINEDLLLGGGAVRLQEEQWELIVASVAKFVETTKRFV